MTAALGTEEYAANLALAHLGKGEIASMVEPNSKRARIMRQHFPAARDATLRRKWWNFATAWVTPAADAVPGTGNFKYRYAMPADCVRVRFVQGCDDSEWAVESGQASVSGVPVETIILVTNVTAPNVCYTRRIEAVRLWDALFLDAFGHELASRGATALGRSQATADRHAAKAKELIGDAATTDSREAGRQRPRPWASILRARLGHRDYR
jgi:hypothetical protein